jgi:penicillin amidase
MFSLTRTFVGLLTVGIIASLAFAVFAFGVATRSASQTEGTVELSGLQNEVSIYRNEYGIPHIVAQSDMEAFFGIGYAHAQDRLWQMDLARRVGRGRLSELFGRRTLEYDIFLRHIGLEPIARRLLKHINPDARAALEAYSNGVNAFLRDHRNDLPFEFDALGFQPDEWSSVDCLLIARMMAWELNLSFWTDAALGAIADTLGVERALQLTPDYFREHFPAAPCVMDSIAPKRALAAKKIPSPQAAPELPSTTANSSIASISFHHQRRQNTAISQTTVSQTTVSQTTVSQIIASGRLQSVLAVGKELRRFLGQTGTAVGSNSWAVRATDFDSAARPRISAAKGAVLANDAHLTLLMPPRWYEAHLSSPSMNVVGFTIPGLPFVLAGRNDDVAWGVTNMMLDDCDFFIEKIDSTDSKRYIAPTGASKPFRVVTDTLRLRDTSVLGGVKDTLIEIRHTERSAVLSDVHPFRRPRLSLNDSSTSAQAASSALFNKYCLSFEWTGQRMSDEILAMYRLQKANSWERFLRAVEGFTVPALNFTFADRFNNVGIAPAGSVPMRFASGVMGERAALFPRIGWQREQQWQGFHEPSELPRLVNPPRGYVVSANNQTARKPAYFLSLLWESPSRAARIEDVLDERASHNASDAQMMQTDVRSPYALVLMPFVRHAIAERLSSLNAVERAAANVLERWNGSMEKSSAAAALFNVFLECYTRNTLQDELGETLYREYCFVTNVPTRKMLELTLADSTQAEAATWFDDKRTSGIETRDDIIRRSFTEAVKHLQTRFGTDDVGAWEYGAIHQVTLPHILGEQPALQKTVNLGPYPVGGASTTINAAEWKFTEPFKPVVGASMRLVCDMSEPVVRMILPGGQSGQALTRGYSDQVQLWLSGGLLAVPVVREPSKEFSQRLVLKPRG